MNIQWYPGHMAKAKRMMADNVRLVDIIIEVLDARAPASSRNPDFEDILSIKRRILVLNKADMADASVTKAWVECFRKDGLCAADVNSLRGDGVKRVEPLIRALLEDKLALVRGKGVNKTIRAMVCGMPNVGKSAFINAMTGSSSTKIGNMPGVTRGKQWVKVSPYMELLDTPGVLVPKIDNETYARHLGYIGCIKDDIMPLDDLACAFLEEMDDRLADVFKERYGIDGQTGGVQMLERLCEHRGFLVKRGELDYDRGIKALFTEFRAGKLGRVSIEAPERELQ